MTYGRGVRMTLGITISLIVATLLLFILILSLYARHSATRDVRILRDVAKKYGGEISVNSFNSSAIMEFPHRGAVMKFYQRKGLSGKATRCFLRCEVDYSTRLSMHITKGASADTSASELRYFLSVPKIEVGSDRFNKEFITRGSNQSFLKALLANGFERQMFSFISNDPILYLHPKVDAVTRITGGTAPNHALEFSVNQTPSGTDDLERLIDDGLALVRRFFGANGART